MSFAAEVQGQLYVAIDRKYLFQESLDEIYGQVEKTGKVISWLINTFDLRQSRQDRRNRPDEPDRQSPLVCTTHEVSS